MISRSRVPDPPTLAFFWTKTGKHRKKKKTRVFLFAEPLDERQIAHLICARLKYDLYDFFRGVFGPFIKEKEQEAGPKAALKKSYRSYFRRAQIRWVIWRSSNPLKNLGKERRNRTRKNKKNRKQQKNSKEIEKSKSWTKKREIPKTKKNKGLSPRGTLKNSRKRKEKSEKKKKQGKSETTIRRVRKSRKARIGGSGPRLFWFDSFRTFLNLTPPDL